MRGNAGIKNDKSQLELKSTVTHFYTYLGRTHIYRLFHAFGLIFIELQVFRAQRH
jgi:hypothetical protein